MGGGEEFAGTTKAGFQLIMSRLVTYFQTMV